MKQFSVRHPQTRAVVLETDNLAEARAFIQGTAYYIQASQSAIADYEKTHPRPRMRKSNLRLQEIEAALAAHRHNVAQLPKGDILSLQRERSEILRRVPSCR